MSFYAQYPASSGGTSSNASVGTNGATAPTSSTEVGGINPGGNLQPLQTDASGNLLVNINAQPTAPFNTNLAQVGGAAISEGQKLMAASLPVVIASDQSTLPISAASLPLPAGASTSALQTSGNTQLVTIASNQTNGTQVTAVNNFPATQPVSGTVTVVQPTGSNLHAVIDSGTISTNADANVAPGTAPSKVLVGGAVYNSTAPTLTNGQSAAIQSDVAGSIKTAVQGLAGIPVLIRPDNELRVAIDASSLFHDSYDSALDTTNRWTTGGTAPTSTTGTLTVSPGTTALATSSLTSQPTFALLGNMFYESLGIITVDSGLKTGNYRFFGMGLVAGSPTVASPLTNAVGFEWSDVDGILRGVIWSGGTKTQTLSLAAVQPTDGAIHRYQIYFKSSRVYFEIDNVSQGSIAYPNPGISTLPVVYLSVNGASTVSPAAIFTSAFASVGDTAANNKTLSDGTYPWRQATVSSTGSLSVSDSSLELTVGSKAPGTAATNSQLVGMVYNSTTQVPTNGQQLALQSDAFGNLETSSPDLFVTGQSAQTAIVNNILTVASGASATDLTGYRSGSVQVVSTGTAGTFIFEGSNDNVNFQAIPVYNQLILTGTPITAAVTATASQFIYTFPVVFRYLRLRIATTITGGSIQAFSKFSQVPFAPAIVQTAQATAANLQTTSTIASGTITTVSAVTSSNSAIPGIIADIASAAITTTTTTATLTPTFGSSYMIDIPVTVVSGTTPTMIVQVQESPDTGTNWYTVYTFPTITTTGSYTSPVITLTGNRIRYVQTIAGTTPSFTRAINRLQSSQSGIGAPGATIFTDRSGTTSGTPSTSTQVAAANNQRRYFVIQNLSLSTPIYINFTSNATAGSGSLYLAPLASYAMESSTITTEAINVLATVASIPFTSKEG